MRRVFGQLSVLRVVAVLAVLGAFAGGYFLADDSTEVDDLKAEVAELEADLEDAEDGLEAAQAAAESAQDEADQLAEERDELKQRLRAEFAIGGEGGAKPSESVTVDTDFPFDAAGKVGPFVIKPAAFEQSSGGWTLTLTVNNAGSTPEDPFCGGGESQLIDTQGRQFDGDSVLADDTANCGDSLQPGLNATYKVSFKAPSDAEPAAIAIWGDSFVVDPSEAKIWGVP